MDSLHFNSFPTPPIFWWIANQPADGHLCWMVGREQHQRQQQGTIIEKNTNGRQRTRVSVALYKPSNKPAIWQRNRFPFLWPTNWPIELQTARCCCWRTNAGLGISLGIELKQLIAFVSVCLSLSAIQICSYWIILSICNSCQIEINPRVAV